MKVCIKCKKEKPLEEYHKDRSRKDGHREACKDCRCKYPKIIEKSCKRCGKLFKLSGKRKLSLYCTRQCAIKTNREDKKINDKNSREKINKYFRAYRAKIKQEDPLYRVKASIGSRIRGAFKDRSFRKENTTKDILGCGFEDFKNYIESKFEPWMTWENYGLYNGTENYGWDIDHIIPIKLAETKEQLIELNHYKNLQPLCSFINRVIKRDHLDAISEYRWITITGENEFESQLPNEK